MKSVPALHRSESVDHHAYRASYYTFLAEHMDVEPFWFDALSDVEDAVVTVWPRREFHVGTPTALENH